MLLSNPLFVFVFLPLVLLFYFAIPASHIGKRNIILIILSLFFYSFGDQNLDSLPIFTVLLLISCLVNFFITKKIGYFIEAANRVEELSEKSKNTRKREYNHFLLLTKKYNFNAKLLFVLGIILALFNLFIFKYTGFIINNLNLIPGINLKSPELKLPIGISFYTFHLISYLIDVYWGKIQAETRFSKFLLYVSIFPKMLAGPIVRYKDMEKDISSRIVTISDISDGITRFASGLAKKVIIADNIYSISEMFLDNNSLSNTSILGSWYGVTIYALYVFFDFSGYSDMAIGIGRILGFKFNENFKYPFICKDITEFWQRWHISLGTFFRDYLLYIPIFGKRRVVGGLFLVWFSTGLWHGASWNFVIWGLYFGIFIYIERLIGTKRLKKIPVALRHIYNKIVIIIGFGIFHFTNLRTLLVFLKNLVGANKNPIYDEVFIQSVINNMFLLIPAVVLCFPIVPLIKSNLEKTNIGKTASGIITSVGNAGLIFASFCFMISQTNYPLLYANF